MKKTLKKFLVALLFIFAILACTHVHNETCGYDFNTKTGCNHKHGNECYEENNTPMPRICVGPDCPEN